MRFERSGLMNYPTTADLISTLNTRTPDPLFAALLQDISELEREVHDVMALIGKAHPLILQIEEHCPCGARPESLDTHPHVPGCAVAELKQVIEEMAK